MKLQPPSQTIQEPKTDEKPSKIFTFLKKWGLLVCVTIYTISGFVWISKSEQKTAALQSQIEKNKKNSLIALMTNSVSDNAIDFEQAIHLINDQEDSSILAAKNATGSFVLLSLGAYTKEMVPQMAEGKSICQVSEKINAVTTINANYYGFLLAIQRLQISNIKEIHDFYRGKLLKFNMSDYGTFISDSREKPKVLNDLAVLYNKIASTNISSNWNSNATVIVDEFINSR